MNELQIVFFTDVTFWACKPFSISVSSVTDEHVASVVIAARCALTQANDRLVLYFFFRIALSFLGPLINAASSDASGAEMRTARRRRFADYVKDGQKEMLNRLLLSCS